MDVNLKVYNILTPGKIHEVSVVHRAEASMAVVWPAPHQDLLQACTIAMDL